ncbi:DUF6457 domain-containing protein [Herbiconiux sp.]|uniref:DUF6457 domain-containing protein n=1 Tax=Herbiconiux sp. TaxID=1871186 RepID=UPI0025BE447E|nr:DUF6457 domain-containing protein [Herbiconiux sp.]
MSAEDDQLRELAAWSSRLAAELRLEGFVVDVEALLALAGVAAHSVRRPAAPLTTYVVGYAAGLAAARQRAADDGTGEEHATVAAADLTAADLTAAADELARAIEVATRLAETVAAEREASDDMPPTMSAELPPAHDGSA